MSIVMIIRQMLMMMMITISVNRRGSIQGGMCCQSVVFTSVVNTRTRY